MVRRVGLWKDDDATDHIRTQVGSTVTALEACVAAAKEPSHVLGALDLLGDAMRDLRKYPEWSSALFRAVTNKLEFTNAEDAVRPPYYR